MRFTHEPLLKSLDEASDALERYPDFDTVGDGVVFSNKMNRRCLVTRVARHTRMKNEIQLKPCDSLFQASTSSLKSRASNPRPLAIEIDHE